MIVVSDASPITNLAQIGRLDLLKLLFGEVVIPPAVHSELLAWRLGATILHASPWIKVEAIREAGFAQALQATLDEGEAQAIAIALELRADLLLMDERQGRAAAVSPGLRATGLVPVLLEAKDAGQIEAVRPALDDLIELAGFYLRRDVYDRALGLAGEGD